MYEIRNLRNGKRYVGSSLNVPHRLLQHLRQLRAGTHHSLKLQRAFAKYGEGSFRFAPLLWCAKEHRRVLEQRAIDGLRCASRDGYNMNPKVTQPTALSADARARLSTRMMGNQYARGHKYTPQQLAERATEVCARGPEWRAKISAAGRQRRLSAASIRKIVATRREHGNYGHSDATREKMSRAKRGRRLTAEHRARIGVGVRAAFATDPSIQERKAAAMRGHLHWTARRKADR